MRPTERGNEIRVNLGDRSEQVLRHILPSRSFVTAAKESAIYETGDAGRDFCSLQRALFKTGAVEMTRAASLFETLARRVMSLETPASATLRAAIAS